MEKHNNYSFIYGTAKNNKIDCETGGLVVAGSNPVAPTIKKSDIVRTS